MTSITPDGSNGNVAIGVLLLKNFDILAEGDEKPIAKTFEHLRTGADGKVEIGFVPVVNYPDVNAINSCLWRFSGEVVFFASRSDSR